jgi:hypothetical protein
VALRVARGLFRLWLILSVLWIGGVGIHAWRTLAPVKVEPVAILQAYAIWKNCSGEPPRDNELEVAPWVIAQCKEIRFASLLAFLPPAFLLALGSALLWALRGFR